MALILEKLSMKPTAKFARCQKIASKEIGKSKEEKVAFTDA